MTYRRWFLLAICAGLAGSVLWAAPEGRSKPQLPAAPPGVPMGHAGQAMTSAGYCATYPQECAAGASLCSNLCTCNVSAGTQCQMPDESWATCQSVGLYFGSYACESCGNAYCNVATGESACTCAADCDRLGLDGDGDGIRNADETAMMTRFAPILKFDSAENYFPSSVEWYLSQTELRMHHDGGCDDCQVLGYGQVTTSNVSKQSHRLKAGTLSCDHTSMITSSTYQASGDLFFLEIHEGINETLEEATRLGDLSSAKCYTHVARSAYLPGGYDIQYWVFYPYNGPYRIPIQDPYPDPYSDLDPGPDLDIDIGGHQGDWEHITVTVRSDKTTADSVYYAAHDNEGRRFNALAVQWLGTSPISFVARGSHASYSSSGWHDRAGKPDDRSNGGGLILDCRQAEHLAQMGEKQCGTPFGQPWMSYAGRWGEIGTSFGIAGGTSFSGPFGPGFQPYFDPANKQ